MKIFSLPPYKNKLRQVLELTLHKYIFIVTFLRIVSHIERPIVTLAPALLVLIISSSFCITLLLYSLYSLNI